MALNFLPEVLVIEVENMVLLFSLPWLVFIVLDKQFRYTNQLHFSIWFEVGLQFTSQILFTLLLQVLVYCTLLQLGLALSDNPSSSRLIGLKTHLTIPYQTDAELNLCKCSEIKWSHRQTSTSLSPDYRNATRLSWLRGNISLLPSHTNLDLPLINVSFLENGKV